jgi:serine protease inhibitor
MKKMMLFCVLLGSAAFLPAGNDQTSSFPIHPELTVSHNQFAFHLLNAVLDEDTSNANKLISPLGVYLALSILYNGAGHATRDSIAETLHATDIDISNLNGMCKELLQQLPLEDDKVEMCMSNSVWCNQKKLSLLPSFLNLCENFYYAPVRSLNFGNPGAEAEINRWADQNTFHRIPAVLGQTNTSDLLYLINATYLKCNWRRAFHIEDTRTDSFYTGDRFLRTTPFMKKSFVTRTYSDTSFTMVELPCGNGKNFNIYIVLPDDRQQSMQGFAASFDNDRLNNALSKMTDQDILLSLPRWEYKYTVPDLKPALCRMGMGAAFNMYDDADFSNMCVTGSRKAFVSKAVHKTSIAVNENGMAASPALPTVIGYGTPSRRISSRPLVIRADHPFMYLLVEQQQHIVLLSGIINDPGKH